MTKAKEEIRPETDAESGNVFETIFNDAGLSDDEKQQAAAKIFRSDISEEKLLEEVRAFTAHLLSTSMDTERLLDKLIEITSAHVREWFSAADKKAAELRQAILGQIGDVEQRKALKLDFARNLAAGGTEIVRSFSGLTDQIDLMLSLNTGDAQGTVSILKDAINDALQPMPGAARFETLVDGKKDILLLSIELIKQHTRLAGARADSAGQIPEISVHLLDLSKALRTLSPTTVMLAEMPRLFLNLEDSAPEAPTIAAHKGLTI